MALFFVGIHNKPGKAPLSPDTKTGKMIDRILARVGLDGTGTVVYRTNLYDLDYLPVKASIDANVWATRVGFDPGKDVLVLLGQEVYNRMKGFTDRCRVVNIPHPGSLRGSRIAEDAYIKASAEEIKLFL